tara:strand:- start:279 stop:551 length:273 start_codon:yes stop_codon:yes gene_type:complete
MPPYDFEALVSRPELEKHLDEPKNIIALDHMKCDEMFADAINMLSRFGTPIVHIPIPPLRGRVDMAKYKSSVKSLKNFKILPPGNPKRRQ